MSKESSQDNSVERVALDLACIIHDFESKPDDTDREYWLDLYKVCLSTVKGQKTRSSYRTVGSV